MITIAEHGSEAVDSLRGLLTLHRVFADLLHLLHVLEASPLGLGGRGSVHRSGVVVVHFVDHVEAFSLYVSLARVSYSSFVG